MNPVRRRRLLLVLLLVVAAVVILPTLDPRNIIPLPAHEVTRLNNNLAALQRGADPEQDFDLAEDLLERCLGFRS